MIGKVEETKKVITKDTAGSDNGFLVELFKSADERKTEVYLTAAAPGAFKGYHLHRVREARYVCLKGKMKITLWKPGTQEKEEHILDAQIPQRLFIPINIATGLQNIAETEGWLINYPNPAYDPGLKDEQVEYTLEELQNGVVK